MSEKTEGVSGAISIGSVEIPIAEAEEVARLIICRSTDQKLRAVTTSCQHMSDSFVSCGKNRRLFGYRLEEVRLEPINGRTLKTGYRQLKTEGRRGLSYIELAVIMSVQPEIMPEEKLIVLPGSTCGQHYMYCRTDGCSEMIYDKLPIDTVTDGYLAVCADRVAWLKPQTRAMPRP